MFYVGWYRRNNEPGLWLRGTRKCYTRANVSLRLRRRDDLTGCETVILPSNETPISFPDDQPARNIFVPTA